MPFKPQARCRICGKKHSGHCSNDVPARQSDGFYRSPIWRRIRANQLKQEPLCRECNKKGLLTPGNEVDHIHPISRGGSMTDPDNLQTLCKSCHSRKTATEMRSNR